MSWPTTSRHERGYGSEWDKRRKGVLVRDHEICQSCKREGRIHAGTHVDHKVSKAEAKRRGWTHEQIEADDNLQCINAECHRLKTEAEQGKTLRPRAVIGADGWPV